MLGDMLTTREAGTELGISANRVLRLIYDKRLPAEKVGRDWHIRRRDLDSVRVRPTGRPPGARRQLAKLDEQIQLAQTRLDAAKLDLQQLKVRRDEVARTLKGAAQPRAVGTSRGTDNDWARASAIDAAWAILRKPLATTAELGWQMLETIVAQQSAEVQEWYKLATSGTTTGGWQHYFFHRDWRRRQKAARSGAA